MLALFYCCGSVLSVQFFYFSLYLRNFSVISFLTFHSIGTSLFIFLRFQDKQTTSPITIYFITTKSPLEPLCPLNVWKFSTILLVPIFLYYFVYIMFNRKPFDHHPNLFCIHPSSDYDGSTCYKVKRFVGSKDKHLF